MIVEKFNRSLKWISKYSNKGEGISINSRQRMSYPEVSGYYIPTLIKWGETERAVSYGNWLVSIQQKEGGWYAPGTKLFYAFDSGQILKGLFELSSFDKKFEDSLIRGCEWICGLINDDGSMNAPDYAGWAGQVPSAVILYALTPVMEAGKKYGREEFVSKTRKALKWFIDNDTTLIEFHCLSHFHAYILEALIDFGELDLARKGLAIVESVQKENGKIPGYKNVSWVCSTGMFQYALCYYKLGELEKGNKAFDYVVKLQNKSGGWYGGYGIFAKYFPWSEISWAVKYFLDALHWRLKLEFEAVSNIFSEKVNADDGRYLLIESIAKKNNLKVLDAGCGKGRYLRNLLKLNLNNQYFASDISEKVMATLPAEITKKVCGLIKIDYQDNFFDFVYTVEALEHVVHTKSALKELARVVKKNGTLVVIDKNIKQLGRLRLPAWEQWFDSSTLKKELESLGFSVKVREGIPFEGNKKNDKLFTAWICTKQ